MTFVHTIVTVVIALATASGGWIIRGYFTPASIPPAISRAAGGTEFSLVWEDFKDRDLEAQRSRLSPGVGSDSAKMLYLLRTRMYIQKQLYRIGAFSPNAPDPGSDGGDGNVQIVVRRVGSDTWMMRGRGNIREFEKRKQGNNEVWAIELWTDPVSQSEFDESHLNTEHVIRVNGRLTSAIREAAPVPVFFYIRLDRSRLWRSTSEDDSYFGESSSKIRVFVDTSTLPGIDLPASASPADRIVHIGTIVWTMPSH